MGETLRKKVISEVHAVHNTVPERGFPPQEQQRVLEQCLLTLAESIQELDSRLEAIEQAHPERLAHLDTNYTLLGNSVREHAAFKHRVEQMLDGIRKVMS